MRAGVRSHMALTRKSATRWFQLLPRLAHLFYRCVSGAKIALQGQGTDAFFLKWDGSVVAYWRPMQSPSCQPKLALQSACESSITCLVGMQPHLKLPHLTPELQAQCPQWSSPWPGTCSTCTWVQAISLLFLCYKGSHPALKLGQTHSFLLSAGES